MQPRNIGPYTAELSDDGSLDTVVLVYLRLQPDHHREEMRYGHEFAAGFRDESGAITEDGWKELSSMAIDDFAEQRAME